MSINQADLWHGLNAAWDASTLDATFKALWPDPSDTDFEVLSDKEASPGQPFPYCVVEMAPPSKASRMSGGVDSLREIRDAQVTFNVHAAMRDGDARAAKDIAAYLVEEITKVFGGHPTQAPSAAIALANGKLVETTYDTDYGVRTDDDEYQWILRYNLRADAPIKV